MRVWDWMYSAITAVKQNTPDVTPVAEIGRKSFDYCRDSTAGVATAATTKAREVHEYLSDDQKRDNLVRFAVNVSKNSTLYLARSYGGGPIIDIVSRSMQQNKADSYRGRLEQLETKVAMLEEELSSRNVSQQLEIQKVTTVSKSQDESCFSATINQRPEEVVKIFMTEQFVGKKLFNNLLFIPASVGSKRMEGPVSSIDGQE